MNMEPLEDRAIIEALPVGSKTPGGLFIPENATERPQKGVVIAVGPGRVTANGETIRPNIKPGDVVVYGKYSGSEVSIEGVNYLIMRESDILIKETNDQPHELLAHRLQK